eukprot:1161047-Pelagomonas_calceolata.AAC.35
MEAGSAHGSHDLCPPQGSADKAWALLRAVGELPETQVRLRALHWRGSLLAPELTVGSCLNACKLNMLVASVICVSLSHQRALGCRHSWANKPVPRVHDMHERGHRAHMQTSTTQYISTGRSGGCTLFTHLAHTHTSPKPAHLPLADPPLGELGAVVINLVHQHTAAKGPDAGKHKVVLQELLVRGRCSPNRLLRQERRAGSDKVCAVRVRRAGTVQGKELEPVYLQQPTSTDKT